jgi:hypothetical protein
MSEPERSRITIPQRDSNEDVTFIATKYDIGTAVTVDGPVPMVIDQIVIDPSDHSEGTNIDCGVAVNYTRTSKYHSHLGSHIVIPPESEVRLVEWLHTNGANFIIETEDFRSRTIEEAKFRGKCVQCGEYFDNNKEWKITLHQEEDYDLHFCTTKCFDNWSEQN